MSDDTWIGLIKIQTTEWHSKTSLAKTQLDKASSSMLGTLKNGETRYLIILKIQLKSPVRIYECKRHIRITGRIEFINWALPVQIEQGELNNYYRIT